ncbi:MAG TPA: nuclear transport factor 2 family protein [Stackebrandtia sp.]|jgi:ketosteroid isomerase-like protein|uniref:nuclear transport factor 2 family protein n=1 Tax=Stackebrandtia sp. TaxID=2023065 RepID=UPI002D5FE2CF|nr:nuclear transport factor 2 family protein [Stackebrandtia sp.]HZE38835.1 nuclear transport factor 2 family protein [Stackebrandtia sp.]
MNDHVDEGLRVALEYYRAWSQGDLERAWGYLAPDVECTVPSGPIAGAESYAEFFGGFAKRVKHAELLASHGTGDSALLMYEAGTDVRDSAPGAEWLTVTDGRIARVWLIFDRLPFVEAQRAAGRG